MIQYKIVGEQGYRRSNSSHITLICCFIFGLTVACFCIYCSIDYFRGDIIGNSYGDKIAEDELSKSFEDFAIAYGKIYSTDKEKANRKAIFASNLLKINEFNMKEDRTVTLGINQFADLSDEEFKSLYLTEKPIPDWIEGMNSQAGKYDSDNSEVIEENIDWEAKKLVAPIKDQGNCGSCWTFGSTSIIESRYAKVEGTLHVFSEQQLVDCCVTEESKGCSGGIVEDALPYVKKNGIAELSEYPYTARDERCRESEMKMKYNATEGYNTVPTCNQMEMQKALLNHTMYVSINAGAFVFRFYKSGVITEGCPGEFRNHGVTLVGSGTNEKGIKFWKIRNSWGKNWGDKGYTYFLRDLEDKGLGMCGIAKHVVHSLYKEDK